MSSSDVSAVTSHFFSPNEGFSTTSSGPVTSGATSVGLTGTTGLTNAAVFVGIIEPGGTKEQVFTGIVDTGGSQITGVKWTKGTNVDHATGVTIVDYVTGTGPKMMTKGILVHADQDGTLKTGAVDVAAVLADSVVTTAKINADAVTAAKLADDSVFPANLTSGLSGSTWAWQAWTPTWTNLSVNNGTVVALYTQTGKTVHARVNIIFGSTTSVSGEVTFSLPVTAATYAGTADLTVIGGANLFDSSIPIIIGAKTTMASSTTAHIRVNKTDATYEAPTIMSGAIPFAWAVSDQISTQVTYEAA